MNSYFRFVSLFFIFAVLISGYGCRSSSGPADSPGNAETSGNENGNATNADKDGGSSDAESYPNPPKKIAAAEFKLLDGGEFGLEASRGKVILINLWATWCGPCRKEMPELVEMQEKYRDRGFEIIGLDTDPETEEEIKEFAGKMKLNYKLGWADRELVEEFFTLGQMNGIPQSFLINRKGKLTGIFQGGSDMVIEKMKETVEKVVAE